MRPHPFRPFDVVLGIGVVIVGVLVATFGFEGVDNSAVFLWLVFGAGVVGLSLLPWPHRRATTPEAPPPLPDESSPDG